MSYEAPISKSTKTRVLMSLRDEENMDDLDQIDTVYLSLSYRVMRLKYLFHFSLLQIKRVNVKLHLKD